MLIKIKYETRISENGRKSKRKMAILQCDGDHQEPVLFKRRFKDTFLKQTLQFCSKQCQHSSSKLSEKIKKSVALKQDIMTLRQAEAIKSRTEEEKLRIRLNVSKASKKSWTKRGAVERREWKAKVDKKMSEKTQEEICDINERRSKSRAETMSKKSKKEIDKMYSVIAKKNKITRSKKSKEEILAIEEKRKSTVRNKSADEIKEWKLKISKAAKERYKKLSSLEREQYRKRSKDGWSKKSAQEMEEFAQKKRDDWSNKSNEERVRWANKITSGLLKWISEASEEQLKDRYINLSLSLLKKYGVENPSQIDFVRETISEWQKDYWSLMNLEERKEVLNNRGFGWKYIEDKEGFARAASERWNKKTEKQKQDIIAKQKQTWSNKTDKEITEITNKTHQTKKRNNSYGKSGTEELRYKYLCLEYGEYDVERQISINGWSIDFYLHMEKIYEEFRGDYFHGRKYSVDELIEMADKHEAKTGKKSQYRTIAGTKLRDEKKDKWFKDNGLELRIIWETDFLEILS